MSTGRFRIPKVGRVGLHAQQWIVGTLPAITRIVSDCGFLLMAEDGDDGAVQVKYESGTVIGLMDECCRSRSFRACNCCHKRSGAFSRNRRNVWDRESSA